ncbi:MAG: MarR family transcriptional regulator [Crocinitomicaceae bacterium]|nr:MarR family transcriptional regulator [Crocinitomicaceae bacterium]
MRSDETIDFHIRWAWYNISRMYNLKASQFGGSMAIGYTLLNIDKEGTPSTKLAPKMGMEPRSLTRMIKQLDENGLIKKQSDKTDKRLVKIFLTEKGKQIRSQAREVVISFNKEIQNEIDSKELATCLSVLNKVNQLIDKNNTI